MSTHITDNHYCIVLAYIQAKPADLKVKYFYLCIPSIRPLNHSNDGFKRQSDKRDSCIEPTG